jgi:hypothetical protein
MTNIQNFNKAIKAIEFCSDIHVSSSDGKTLELGMALDEHVSFHHVLETNVITLNIDYIPVLTIKPDSPIIEAFRDLLNSMDDMD